MEKRSGSFLDYELDIPVDVIGMNTNISDMNNVVEPSSDNIPTNLRITNDSMGIDKKTKGKRQEKNEQRAKTLTIEQHKENAAATTGLIKRAPLEVIDKLWNRAFNLPLATDKSSRVQQAINFMRAEELAHLRNKKIVKHSFRQISLYFNIPKSTLYDRLKTRHLEESAPVANRSVPDENSDNQANQIDIKSQAESYHMAIDNKEFDALPVEEAADAIIEALVEKEPPQPIDLQYKRYAVQMKLTLDKELELLKRIKALCYGFGNIIGRIDISNFIKNNVDENVELGKTWLKGFLNRNKDYVIYGPDNSDYNVSMADFKLARNNYKFLWKCFITELQLQIKGIISRIDPIFLISITYFQEKSKCCLITCLEIRFDDCSGKLITRPKVLLFPDHIADMQYSGASNDDVNNDMSKEISQNIDICDRITNVLLNMISTCIKYDTKSEGKPFILLDGFNEYFHWDIPTCQEIIKTCNLFTLPWKEKLFKDLFYERFSQKLGSSVHELSYKSTTTSVIEEFDLDTEGNYNDLFREIKRRLFNIGNMDLSGPTKLPQKEQQQQRQQQMKPQEGKQHQQQHPELDSEDITPAEEEISLEAAMPQEKDVISTENSIYQKEEIAVANPSVYPREVLQNKSMNVENSNNIEFRNYRIDNSININNNNNVHSVGDGNSSSKMTNNGQNYSIETRQSLSSHEDSEYQIMNNFDENETIHPTSKQQQNNGKMQELREIADLIDNNEARLYLGLNDGSLRELLRTIFKRVKDIAEE